MPSCGRERDGSESKDELMLAIMLEQFHDGRRRSYPASQRIQDP
jgi:hypothetical protein